MTVTLEGVRDPLRVSPDPENCVVRCNMLPPGHDDIVCNIDDDGVVRWPEGRHSAGKPVPWHSYTIMDYDVDPEDYE